MAEKQLTKGQKRRNRIILYFVVLLLVFVVSNCNTVNSAKKLTDLGDRSQEQNDFLESVLDQNYPERTSIYLNDSPFKVRPDYFNLNAKSAIILDVRTGSILYEKDADLLIPPASMTKIIEMYVVLEHVEKGLVSLDDVVPLPPESWVENIPWDASRMGLRKDQRITLRELLLGLSICSGNDASVAVAHYVCGSMEAFVEKMNQVVFDTGLTQTHFVESSGYSEENLTTAREFATFARKYINRFPYALSEFHSQPSIIYPKLENEPTKKPEEVVGIKMVNTNMLLDKIPGCDGLKTGYIDESGYNISVTAEQNGTRFLSVTMGASGKNMIEGNKNRVADNYELFDFCFANFADYIPQKNQHEYTVPVFAAKENAVKLVPALDEIFVAPILKDENNMDCPITVETVLPQKLVGEIECGKVYGQIRYNCNGQTLRILPLVADRQIPKAGFLKTLVGKVASNFF